MAVDDHTVALRVDAELLARLSTRGEPAAIAARDLGRYYLLLAYARRELKTPKGQLAVFARILAAGALEVSEAALLFLDHLVRIRAQYRYAGSDYAKLLKRLESMSVLQRLALIDAVECQLQAQRRAPDHAAEQQT